MSWSIGMAMTCTLVENADQRGGPGRDGDHHDERRAQQQGDRTGGDPGQPGGDDQPGAGGYGLERGQRGGQGGRQGGGGMARPRRVPEPGGEGQAPAVGPGASG